MKTLIIRHVAKSEPAQFPVVRQRDGKSNEPTSVASPFGFPVEGRPESDLIRELNWYLETVLDYPFEPEIGHAGRVMDSLRAWGQQAFEALFDGRDVGGRIKTSQWGSNQNQPLFSYKPIRDVLARG